MTSPAIPGGLEQTRHALHQLVYFVLAPARYRHSGRMGLVVSPGGFGTPPMDGRVLRLDGDLLVDEGEDTVATRTITTLGDAIDFFGGVFDPNWFEGFRDELEPLPLEAPLGVDREASRFIAEVFALGQQVLQGLGRQADITEIWLWPEHFDLATEAGDEAAGRKASYGVSPGDHAHPEPYFYVSAWGEIDRSDRFWNDTAFKGASLAYADVVGSEDPVETAVDFLLTGYRSLHTG